jgi:cold-inducible RNA-binding protein
MVSPSCRVIWSPIKGFFSWEIPRGTNNVQGGRMSTRLYVGNISFKGSEDDLKELFSQAGEVVSVKLIKDAATGRLRGFGFVEMASDEDAQKAISMLNGKAFMDRNIVVNEAKPQERRERGGGPQRERGGFGRGRRKPF